MLHSNRQNNLQNKDAHGLIIALTRLF